MQKVILGKNGPEVTALGIGTWSWGDQLFWNYGQEYGAQEVKQAFLTAVQAGITFFDTAEVYGLGLSEKLLGQFMAESGYQADIATKYAPLPWRLFGSSVSDALSDSLSRLQLKQVILYQVHWPFNFFMGQKTLMNALADEVAKGRIVSVGVSNYSAAQMREAHQLLGDRGVSLAVNQVQYSLLFRKVETQGIISTAKELGVTILAYSPLAQGLLTGKYTVNNAPSGARKADPRFQATGLKKIQPVLDLLAQIGDKYQKTPTEVALNWLIAQENVIPIPGAKNAAQVEQNIGALGWSLSPDEVAQLEKISQNWL